jgi:pimeloyl-ACP methyl ester carboxylesterase
VAPLPSKIDPTNVDLQLAAASTFSGRGEYRKSFAYLERAHVLALNSTLQHVRVHWLMLLWAIRQRNMREGFGQVARIIGAASMTALGMVPSGNTGGSNVSTFRPLPIPADLAVLLTPAGSHARAWLVLGSAVGLILALMIFICAESPANVRTVLVNSHQMSFRVMGNGRPVLVFISGLGDDMTTFDEVAKELGKHATVITYDRAGYGHSEVAPGPRDAKSAEADLFSLLAQSGVQGPYVLAGHSLGGLYAEYYAARHPAQVSGLILEDSRPADFSRRCLRLTDKPMCGPPAWSGWIMSRGGRDELANLDKIMVQAGRSAPITGKPVLVLSRSRDKSKSSFDVLWARAQDDLARRYPGSEHLRSPGSSHDIHHDQRDWLLASVRVFLKGVK